MKMVCLCLLMVATGCVAAKKTSGHMDFDWQGHRGSRGLFPENTIPAMLHAVDLGVTTLEMDAVITKDKQVILSHDPFFSHDITTKPDGNYVTEAEEKKLNLYQMTYKQIGQFDVGMKVNSRFQQQKKMKVVKPLLSDVIDSVESYSRAKNLPLKYYNIETKSKATTDNIYHPSPPEFVELLVAVIRSKGIETRTVIQSFDVRTLQYLHQKYPGIKTSLLIEGSGSSVEEELSRLGFTPSIYSPEYRLVNKTVITDCKRIGMRVIPWTVNNVAKMKELKELGVDGIITDYPNLIF